MSSTQQGTTPHAYWFVGATFGPNDQVGRFLAEGLWENGYTDKYLDLVKSIQPGDRIAIKSTYVRKHDLPFDNAGQAVSVMAIKALGTVTENLGDGRRVRVDWTPLQTRREWYFFTHLGTIWRVTPGRWEMDALIAFAFDETPQDLDRFRNAPSWRERFGDSALGGQRFRWTRFYEAVADRLLGFRDSRPALLAALADMAQRVEGLSYLQDQYADGTKGPLRDIDPFTVLGTFNRGISNPTRRAIAQELAKFLQVEVGVPESFEGIPVLNNFKAQYFVYEADRRPDDIDALWDVFAAAIRYAGLDEGAGPGSEADATAAFADAFDEANGRQGIGWNLSMGLYWIRPWSFVTLDQRSQAYITAKLAMRIDRHGPKGRCSASDYLDLVGRLETRFEEETYPVHSFPELSLAAWLYRDGDETTSPEKPGTSDREEGEAPTAPAIVPYTFDDVMAEGCFLERGRLQMMLVRLREKRNLILQGPPGTGKTWLARRLAYVLAGQRDDRRVRALQFHPNLSYEDFVRGWRPTGDGKLDLVDGPFLEVVNAAAGEPAAQYVVVIEEINRGNPAQIFGEMLTLLEADKRTPTEALELCYRRSDTERVYIPGNVYVIGTMNIADRSLALVDLALRRRFAFVDLEPTFGEVWRSWVVTQCQADGAVLAMVEQRLRALNEAISDDSSLGPQFRVGHSYVTPPPGTRLTDTREWFRQVVDTELAPLLVEYWFDAPDRAQQACERLLEGL